jgi:hypothetical protein
LPPQNPCHSKTLLKFLLTLIPDKPQPQWLLKPNAFSRDRKFTFRHVVAFCLSHIASIDNCGTSIALGKFLKNAIRSNLWDEVDGIDDSCISRARSKLCWRSFEFIHKKAIKMAYSLWNDKPWHSWNGMSVFAIDGSKFRLPASASIRKAFDPIRNAMYSSKGHFPQCHVSTAYDVLRRLPIARIVEKEKYSERQAAISLLAEIPKGGVIILDRGYPSYELIKSFIKKYKSGYFLIRCSTSSTYKAVDLFLKSGKNDADIQLKPTSRFIRNTHQTTGPVITVRAIRLKCYDGTISVLLTNLPRDRFHYEEISALYYRRWEIETYYRDEKETIGLETFHTKTPNGIRQEFLCAAIVSVLARTIMMMSNQANDDYRMEPQFKNAVVVLTEDLSLLISKYPRKALMVLEEIIELIKRVRYYRPLKKRAPQPRITKRPANRWIKCRGDMQLIKIGQN